MFNSAVSKAYEQDTTDQDIFESLEQFRRDNPQIVEAMDLFGMSMAEYQDALHAMFNPQIIQGSTTSTPEQPGRHEHRAK
jgi:hypothetical protein